MYAGLVVASPGDDEIGILLRRFDELVVHRLEHLFVALQHLVNGSSTLHDIAADISDKTDVGISLYEDFQVHHIAQLLMVQRHDTLEDDDGFGFHMNSLRKAVGDDIRILGLLDSLSVLKHPDMLCQQLPVESIRVVEIDSFALLISHACRIVVIRVQRYYGCIAWGQRTGDSLDDGGLS